MKKTTLLAACALSLFAAAAVQAQPVVRDGVLADAAGRTVYTFDKDEANSGKSVCNGPCATNWPPLMASDMDRASGDYSIISRDDGKRQWAFKGKPLYFWAKDMKPGDRTGDGFNKVWQLARP